MIDVAKLQEIARLLDEATDKVMNEGGGGKSSEGTISLRFNTAWDRLEDGDPFELVEVSVYSYLLGPSRHRDFPSVDAALAAVREWHRDAMEEAA